MPELKPCPFCGVVPKIEVDDVYKDKILAHHCEVVNLILIDWISKNEEAIAKVWNTRDEE